MIDRPELKSIQEEALRTTSLSELSETLIPYFMDQIGAEGGSILVQDGDVLVVQTAFGLKTNRADSAKIPLGVGITGQAAEKEAVQWIPDVRDANNHIEGVPDSRWELAVPMTDPEHNTTLVLDFESSTSQRPAQDQRERLEEEIASIKTPLLKSAENERLKRSYRKDSISFLQSGEYFQQSLDTWFRNHPERSGLLIVLQLEPRLEDPEINSFRDLRGQMNSLGSHLRNLETQTTFTSRLYGNIFATFVPDVDENDGDRLENVVVSELSQVCDVEQINSSYRAAGNGKAADLINNAFVELNLATEDSDPEVSFELNRVLREGNIRLVKQPIVQALSEDTIGYEILVRGPEDSQLESPGRLFEAAYQKDRVVSLDSLITKKAVSTDCGTADQLVFLNVERKTLNDPDWRTMIVDLLQDQEEGNRVCIEITEHGQLTKLKPHLDEMRKKLGDTVKFAIDDFGTGSSNFKAIIDLDPDILKIDRSLIRNIDKEFGKRSFVESIMNFTESTETRVLAEGIEKENELATLKELGVELMQGYHFAKPRAIN